jgi:UDP-4-amino-4-deoxy-L-arabinose formyltransferase/UDP-glucuronic acid dehydrogenase (UDP-4-keto-hexauronic acid decarboxylating)
MDLEAGGDFVRFAALGRTRWLLESIQRARESGHEPVLIGTCAASPEYDVVEQDFELLARQIGCPFFSNANLRAEEPRQLLDESRADLALSINWLTLIGADVRERFRHGVLNAHAGDLPRFRGNACPNWAILSGEERVVVSIHRMADGIDDGPILVQRSFPLDEDTYVGDVYAFMNAAIPEMFVEVLDALELGDLPGRSQPEDPALALRCYPRRPCDAEITWSCDAITLARLVRASAEPFGGATTWLDGERVRIWRARPERLPFAWLGVPGQVAERRTASGELVVLTGSGVLVVSELETEAAGRKPAADVVRSTRARFGLDLAAEVESLRRRVADLEASGGSGRAESEQ